MARSFNGTNGYLEYGMGAVVTAAPLTFACWAFCNSLPAGSQILMSVGNGTAAGANNFFLYIAGGLAGKPVGMFQQTAGAGSTKAVSTAGPTAGQWFHAAGWVASNTSRAAYFQGANKGTDSTNLSAPTGLSVTDVGVGHYNNALQLYFAGLIAEPAVWNVALTDPEIAALAQGVRPHLIRPSALVGYWPLWGLASPEVDLSGSGRSLVLGGVGAPTPANHGPLTPFTRKARTQPLAPAVAAGGLIFGPKVIRPRLSPAHFE